MTTFRNILLVVLLPFSILGQEEERYPKSNVFGQIFTGFRYGLNEEIKPGAAFEFNQGILGLSHEISSRISGKIMYDVTRTTHLYEIYDSSGTSMNYNYFEGSKYTAYLKMAEIKWDVHECITLRAGQLLTNQYLTFQDRFWGYRYIDVTFQEKYRLGMPADFGVQVDYKYKDKVLNQLSAVNGEGPFRYQDDGGKFLFSNNIQYYPVKNITLKLYTDLSQKPDTGINLNDKYVVAGFAGYKTGDITIGAEYVYIANWNYKTGQSVDGVSVYGSVRIFPKISCVGRYDYLQYSLEFKKHNIGYYIAGLHYEPHEKLYISANYRYYAPVDHSMIFCNFGLFL